MYGWLEVVWMYEFGVALKSQDDGGSRGLGVGLLFPTVVF